MKESKLEININALPSDCLSLILSHFQKNEQSYIVSLVCKKWSELITRDPKLPISAVLRYYSLSGNIQILQYLR